MVDYATKVQQFQNEDAYSADTMGMLGWGIIGGMNVFNFLYYGDLYYKRYTVGKYNSFDGLNFMTVYGGTNWVRIMLHVVVSFMMMVFWCLTFIPFSGFWYLLYYVSVYFYTGYYLARTFLIILFQCAAFFADDFDKSYKYYNYFQEQIGMGHEQSEDAEELQWEEYKLEAANVLAAVLAVPMFTSGMKFWYLNNDEYLKTEPTADKTQSETDRAQADNSRRIKEASDVLVGQF